MPIRMVSFCVNILILELESQNSKETLFLQDQLKDCSECTLDFINVASSHSVSQIHRLCESCVAILQYNKGHDIL